MQRDENVHENDIPTRDEIYMREGKGKMNSTLAGRLLSRDPEIKTNGCSFCLTAMFFQVGNLQV